MKRVACFLAGVVLVAVLLFGACANAAQAPAKPVVLKAVTFLPMNHPSNNGLLEYIKRVNEQAKGDLKIDLIGGPEAMPGTEQVKALKSGAIDVCLAAHAQYSSLLPEVATHCLTRLDPMQERKIGYYDLLNKLHQEKVNAFYLASGITAKGYYLYTNIKVSRPQELKGQRISSYTMHIPFVQALGCTPVTLAQGEVYSALERKIVNGMAEPSAVAASGLTEVCKYRIDHPYYQGGQLILINLDVFKRLTKRLQDLLVNVGIEVEPWERIHFTEQDKVEKQKAEKAGMQPIVFSPDDAKWYLGLAYSSKWALVEKDAPGNAAKIKEILSKQVQ